MSNKSTVRYNGISFASVLGIVFITLKICDKIQWNWVWVLSPFWIPFALIIVIYVLAFMFAYVWNMIARIRRPNPFK